MEQFQMDLAGRTLTIETGELAKQAGGAVMVGYGDTRVLVTATGSKEAKDIDFFPLTVDYEEKMYAIGRLPGGFIKREARPPESAILNSRLIDRPIRPLFDKGVRNEVHVVATVMSVDQDCDPAICGMIGASAALSISDIPWTGPIAGVRMGRVNGEFVVNPTKAQLEETDLNIVVAGTKDAILMVEGGAQEVPEETILEVIMAAHEEIKKIVAFQEDVKAKVGKEKRVFESKDVPAEIADAVREYGHDKLDAAVRCADKQQRDAQETEVREDVLAHFADIYPDNLADVNKAFDAMTKEIVRHMITVEKIRPDGRKLDEVRPISCRTGVLPRTHGSGLFTRGQTQVLNVATVAPLSEKQTIDGIGLETEKRYIHHYNFPSFSVGETRSSRGPGRREIGHGALAERALVPVIPSEEEFPYALRLVSEVLESNGSSSMASVCGSTLSLMDAGVPIKAIIDSLTTFSGIEHRLQYVGTNRTNKYYNDSKATNTLATQFALNSFNQPIIWLCGGLDRGNEFDELIPYMENVRAMVVFGQTKAKFAKLGNSQGKSVI
ncbi:MAG: polyribonucleotide nucleotidyltransferase, partial [Veillonella sp.]|uniref:polyribonucleotide nucleotidyltransferase n=1 Tax=Veillonella sp. TaxID=1926307 RepID=UPI00290AA034